MILNASSKKAQNELKTFFHRDIFTRAYSLSLFPEYSPFSKNANPGQISNYIGARVLNGEVRFL